MFDPSHAIRKMKNECYFLILCLVNFNAKCHELLSYFLFYIYVFDSHADHVVLDSTGIDSFQAGIRVRIKHGLILHPRIRIGINSADPKSESESIPPMNDRFRPQCSKVPVCPNTLGPWMIFLQLRAILQLCLLPEATFIHIFDVV